MADLHFQAIPTAGDLITVSGLKCTPSDLLRMERIILDKLGWNLNAITPLYFLQVVSIPFQTCKNVKLLTEETHLNANWFWKCKLKKYVLQILKRCNKKISPMPQLACVLIFCAQRVIFIVCFSSMRCAFPKVTLTTVQSHNICSRLHSSLNNFFVIMASPLLMWVKWINSLL